MGNFKAVGIALDQTFTELALSSKGFQGLKVIKELGATSYQVKRAKYALKRRYYFQGTNQLKQDNENI